jgi:hypothetical protein
MKKSQKIIRAADNIAKRNGITRAAVIAAYRRAAKTDKIEKLPL